MKFLAIDPGASGGFAWLDDSGCAHAAKMPKGEKEICSFLRRRFRFPLRPDFVMLEQVGGFIAGKFTPGSAMFSFGENFGLIKGCLFCSEISFATVHPKKWQNALELGKKKNHDKEVVISRGKNKGKKAIRSGWKEHLKNEAQKRFPNINVNFETADALLILAYCQQFYVEKHD